MSAIKSYLLPLCLLLASLFLLTRGMNIKKDSQRVWKDVVKSQLQQNMNASIAPADAQMIGIRNIVAAIGRQYDIPLVVVLKGATLDIRPDIGKIKPEQLLSYDSNIYGFINTLSSLPYKMEYERLCIGADCGAEGFAMSITVKGV